MDGMGIIISVFYTCWIFPNVLPDDVSSTQRSVLSLRMALEAWWEDDLVLWHMGRKRKREILVFHCIIPMVSSMVFLEEGLWN